MNELTVATEDELFDIKPKGAISEMEIQFAHYYLGPARLNASKAAVMAGYHDGTAGWRIKNKPAVKDFIEQLNNAKVLMNLGELKLRLTEIANGSIEPFMNEEGALDLTTDSAKENLHLIKGAKTKTSYDLQGNHVVEVDIKLHDAHAATVDLIKIEGGFIERVEHSGTVGVSVNARAFEALSDEELERAYQEQIRDYKDARIVEEPASAGVGEVSEGLLLLDK